MRTLSGSMPERSPVTRDGPAEAMPASSTRRPR